MSTRKLWVAIFLIFLCCSNLSSAQIITTVAGMGGAGYNGDGLAPTATQFNGVSGVAFDGSGNCYIADCENNRIRKISASGVVSTVAGTGVLGFSGDGGPATAARLNQPITVALDGSGNVYFGCEGELRKVNSSGIISAFAGNGTAGYSGDGGPATAALISNAYGIVFDGSGNLIFTDIGNSRVRKINSAGIITTIAGTTTSGYSGDGGAATDAELNGPYGITINSSGEIIFSDAYNKRVRKISTSGVISTVAGTGAYGFSGDGGAATAAVFAGPGGMACDASGNVYVSDNSNCRVRVINTSGIINTMAGSSGRGYTGDGVAATAATLLSPNGLTFDGSGNLYIADGCQRIRMINSAGVISTFAGMGHPGYTGDGAAATTKELYSPFGVALDTNGNIYIADEQNSRIRKVTPSGIISTLAGTGSGGYSGDGGPATAAQVYLPSGVATDRLGNVYIADEFNSRVRKVDASGTITTIAGGGTSTSEGVPATSYLLQLPIGVAADNSGNVYVINYGHYTICKINSSGYISTIAGTGVSGFSGDGGAATAAKINQTLGITVDGAGNVYIADNGRIRKINTSGIINTIAGSSGTGFSGDGGPATSASLFAPYGVAIDLSGNMYIADFANNRIRKVNTSGIISTIAGDGGTGGYTGDGGAATDAQFFGPQNVAVDLSGNVYVADLYNNVIRKVITCTLPVAGTITGSTTICAGSTITLTDASTGGAWSSSNSAIASVGGTTGIVNALSGGTVLISYSVTNSCATIATSVTLTVTPLPGAGAITGTTHICRGASTTLSDTATGGTWISNNHAIATVSGTGAVSSVAIGTVGIMYVVTNSCGADTTSVILTVNPLPNSGIITGTAIICPHTTTTLSDTASGGTWVSNNHGVATVSGTGVVSSFTAGTVDIMYLVANSCGTDTTSFAIVVRDSSICHAGVTEVSKPGPGIQIFPNPNMGTFSLMFGSIVDEEVQLTITNMHGQKVKEMTIVTNKETEVQLQVPAGVYFVTGVVGGERLCERLVVE